MFREPSTDPEDSFSESLLRTGEGQNSVGTKKSSQDIKKWEGFPGGLVVKNSCQ